MLILCLVLEGLPYYHVLNRGRQCAMGMTLLSPRSSPGTAFFWSILLGFSLSGWSAMVMVLSTELGGVKLAASVFSVMITIIGSGFLIGPIVFGYVADHAGYYSSWLIVVITSLFSVGKFMPIDALLRKRDCNGQPDGTS